LPVGAFLRLGQPAAFDAPDDKPVEFVLALLLPCRDPQRQLNLLAAVVEKFSDGPFRDRVAHAVDPAAAWRVLTAGVSP